MSNDIKDYSYTCADCGFHYRDEETAKECEKWCTEKGVCNSEIRKHAYEMQKDK